MRSWLILVMLCTAAFSAASELDEPPVQSIALDGPARERHYIMLYSLGAASLAAAAGGIAVRRRMLRALDAGAVSGD